MNKVQGWIVNLTEFIESLLVPAFLMLFAIAVSGFHIYKFVEGADGPIMGIVMGVGVSMMTIFFANRSLRPTGRERWVAMGFLVVFAGLSTIWQFLYQRDHFSHAWIAATVAAAMPIAEIGLGIVAALQRKPLESAQGAQSAVAVQTVNKKRKSAYGASTQRKKGSNSGWNNSNSGAGDLRSVGNQRSEAPGANHPAPGAADLGADATSAAPEQEGGRVELGTEERKQFVEDWLHQRLELHRTSAEQWPEVVSQVNVAQLTRELGEILSASNRTIRRDVDAAIERFAVDVEDVHGQLIYQEIEVSTNGKGH